MREAERMAPALLAIALLGAANLHCTPAKVTIEPPDAYGAVDYVFSPEPDATSEERWSGPSAVAVAPGGDVWTAFGVSGQIGILSGKTLVRCTVPGMKYPYGIARSGNTIVIDDWRNGTIAAVDATSREVSWSVTDAALKKHPAVAALPGGTFVAYSQDNQPGIVRVSSGGVTPMIDARIRQIATSPAVAYALDDRGEIYRWTGSRFENYVRLSPVYAVAPVKGNTVAVYAVPKPYTPNKGILYYQRAAFMDSKGSLRDFGDWPPYAGVNDSLVDAAGDADVAVGYQGRFGNPSGGGNLFRMSPSGGFAQYTFGKTDDPLDALALAPDGTIWIAQYYGDRLIALPPGALH